MSFGITDSEWAEPLEEPVPKIAEVACIDCPLWHRISSGCGWCTELDDTTSPTNTCVMSHAEWLEINEEER